MVDPRRHEAGFTLAEMLAALGILLFGVTSLLAAMASSIGQRRTADARLVRERDGDVPIRELCLELGDELVHDLSQIQQRLFLLQLRCVIKHNRWLCGG